MDEAAEDVKTELFCIVVGDEEPFPVDINLKTKKVGDLKKKIKAENQVTVSCDAKDLKLFLAKRGQDGDWLNMADAAAVMLDEHGKFPRDFEKMDPTLLLEDGDCFGDDFEPKKNQVHVLVVLPIDRAAERQKVGIDLSYREDVAAILALATALERPTSLETGKLLALPDTVLCTAFSNDLYIRHEYWALVRIIQNALASFKATRRVLVVGSPGIGKSVFGVFLLLLFMTEKKDVAYCPLGQSGIYYFNWDASGGYTVSGTPCAGKVYEGFFDGSERDGAFNHPHFHHVYLFASPRTNNYNTFVKEGCFQVIMNPWTKAECQSLAELIGIGNQDEWYHKFNLIGGIPRLVFPTSPGNTFDDLARRVEAAVPTSVDKLKREIDLFQRSEFNYGTKHIVYHMRRDEHWPSLFYPTYASLAVETLFSARLNIRAAVEIQKVLQILAPSCQKSRGNEMDKFLLESLVSSKFCMKALEEGSAKDVQNFGPINARTEVVHVTSEIKDELVLYLPFSKSFPAIDGVLVVPVARHIFYVQSTVSKAHSIKYQRLKDVYEDLVGRRGDFQDYTHVLLFLVSNDMYDRFTAQPYQNEDGEKRHARPDIKVKQCVGKIVA